MMATTHTIRTYFSRLSEHEHPEAPWRDLDFADIRPKSFSIPFASVLRQATQLSLFVDIDADVLGGTPRIGGTRIPVYMVLNAIDEHGSIHGARSSYRSLTEEQIRDALRFAVHVLESPVEHEPSAANR